MSITVNYYSFSPSRADQKWVNFVEDILVLRKKHCTFKEHHENSLKQAEQVEKIRQEFEPEIQTIQKKIFDVFIEKGYVVPRGWTNLDDSLSLRDSAWRDEEKMEYLAAYGPMYKLGSNSRDKNTPYMMLHIDTPELAKEYYEKIGERQSAIEKFLGASATTPHEDTSIILNERQENLDHGLSTGYLKYEDKFNEKELLYALKSIDLYYGAVRNEYFDDDEAEYSLLESSVKSAQLEVEDDLPTKMAWIQFFSSINTEKILKIAALLETDPEEVYVYLKNIRPVIKDLKDTPDAIFVRDYNEMDIGVQPENAEKLLEERAKKHMEEYRGLIKPVL